MNFWDRLWRICAPYSKALDSAFLPFQVCIKDTTVFECVDLQGAYEKATELSRSGEMVDVKRDWLVIAKFRDGICIARHPRLG